MKTWSLKKKLTMSLIACGTLPMLIVSVVSYQKAKEEIRHQANSRAYELAEDRERQLYSYIGGEINALKDFSRAVRQQLIGFNEAFEELKSETLTLEERKEVEEFYKDVFAKTYNEKTGKTFEVSTYLSRIDSRAILMQRDFIAANKHPLGEKHKLERVERKTTYAEFHAEHHSSFKEQLEKHGLYDIFLVNPSGDIVYSVFKETDFATNLLKGPLADSGLAAAFKKSQELKYGEAYLEDMRPYGPSYDSPAIFAGTPVFYREKYIGSVVIQFPFEKINEIVNARSGLGEKGQVILAGPDAKLRANGFINPEKYSVANFFTANSTVTLESEAIKLAISSGDHGVVESDRSDGTRTLSFYHPMQFENLKWFMSVELSYNEIFNGVYNLLYWMIGLMALAQVAIGAFSWWMSGKLANTVQSIIERLNESSQKVASASTESAASATELSEAATEQAASLQETMASVEEISAMVNQNADSASKAKSAVESNAKSSNEGTQSVEQMMVAIQEIKKTNDDILGQMESSNKEFGEIVKIISEIGDKTKVINDIVFQTKLLSFNASVEAARAGEHGKGFAVVAEEVGNLAQMSGNAAKEIGGMLSESIKRVNDIVEQTTAKVDQLVEVGKDKISMGQATAEQCQSALKKIAENAKTVATMVTEIAHASQEQSQGIQEINKAISQLDQVTQQNSAVSQQSSAQAESLSGEAQSLGLAVGELVSFVSGSGSSVSKSPKSKTNNDGPSSSLKMDHVIELKPRIAHAAQKKKTVSEQEKILRDSVTKKAVGSEIVPSSEDPGFEEF